MHLAQGLAPLLSLSCCCLDAPPELLNDRVEYRLPQHLLSVLALHKVPSQSAIRALPVKEAPQEGMRCSFLALSWLAGCQGAQKMQAKPGGRDATGRSKVQVGAVQGRLSCGSCLAPTSNRHQCKPCTDVLQRKQHLTQSIACRAEQKRQAPAHSCSLPAGVSQTLLSAEHAEPSQIHRKTSSPVSPPGPPGRVCRIAAIAPARSPQSPPSAWCCARVDVNSSSPDAPV